MFYSSSYYDLVLFTYFISAVIPVLVFGGLGLCMVFSRGLVCKVNSENEWVEMAWTFIPTFVVFILCYLNVQFMAEEECINLMSDKCTVIKVVGNQWYWSYSDEFSGGNMYDSIMTDFIGAVDKPIRMFSEVAYKFAVTSADVIHSFALPDFEIKIDAIPGRIGNDVIFPTRCGIYIGYCSELCGAGHAYMPIVLEVLNKQK